MEKIKIFLILTAFLFIVPSSFAQTPTTEKDTTENKIEEKIDELKNRVASKVAELNLVEKRGMIGKVTDVSGTRISILDIDGNLRFIDVDEFTEFSGESGKELGLSDLKDGVEIGALGLYNKESRKLLGRFIEVLSLPTQIVGGISNIDEKNFSVSVITEDQKEYTVDIETITKTFLITSDSELERSGFSKLSPRENVIVVGFADPEKKDRLTASKIFHFEGIPLNPRIPIVEEIVPSDPTIIPSTGSGKKLTPLR
ncbi:MAG: hypothetical protein HYT09_01265 [Candidatus Levybacteria bacterium]|nr:hypothetical protein [Candidatus Levybacteria bacterium]